MNKEDKVYYEYIKPLLSLDFNKKDNIDTLKLFSEYISSNKNFKYNKTYLIDSIKPFIGSIKSVQNKVKKCQEFADFLSVKYENFGDWVIIIDNIFLIDNKFKFHQIFDLVDDPLYNKLRLREYLNKYNLFSQNKNKLVLKYINMNMDINNPRDYTKQYNIGDVILFSLVKNTLTVKKEDVGN